MWGTIATLAVGVLTLGIAAEWFVSWERRQLSRLRRYGDVLEALPPGAQRDAFEAKVNELTTTFLQTRLLPRSVRAREAVLLVSGLCLVGAVVLRTGWQLVLDDWPRWAEVMSAVLLLTSLLIGVSSVVVIEIRRVFRDPGER